MKIKIMTVDLEPDLRSNRCLSITKTVPRILNFFDDNNIKATFFIVTNLFEKYESEIKEIARKHEIASHSHTHNWLNERNANFEIGHSKLLLKNYGIKCEGFRAPKFITTKNHFEILRKHGYKYDSSFNGKFKVSERQGIKSITFPAFYSGLTYRKLLHPFSKSLPSSKMFYLHPWEFLKKEDLPKSNSVIKVLLKRNSGFKAWKIYKNYIEKEECKWVGCEEWLNK